MKIVYSKIYRTLAPFAISVALGSSMLQCTSNHQTSNLSSLDSALSSFELPKGFKIEIVAAEPLLGDPVDMEIDEYGRMYVVEMPGYPLDKSGTGKVKVLSDGNGDGRMDSAIVFADNLVLPNSVMRWKKGILVTDAPYVLYFEDTNGDNKADVRDTVLTGFALSNPQHNLNSPLLGIDNWIYLAHEGAVSTDTYEKEFGDRGGEIYYTKRAKSPRLGINANGRSVRFKPDDLKLEETSGHTQFGHTFDQWGHHFLVGNANHIYQEVIAAAYLERNKQLLVSDATNSISDHGEAAEVFPITQNPQHQLLTDVGVITSACGLTAYLGGAFPAPYDEQVTFVAEPVSNLVHVDKIQPSGATFVASRVIEHNEFLASRDARFRPVNLYIGPDGALYVVDYYRQIIEHPEWMGEEVIKSGKLYNDSDRGRIYRISPVDMPKASWTSGIDLGKTSSAGLVKHLSDKNVWWRMNAQRLLVDRRDASIANALRAAASQAASPVGRLHALWTLEGMKSLTPEVIAHALKDSEAGVRENAIRLAELQLPQQSSLLSPLFTLASDPDEKVRYQLLCTIGSVTTPGAAEVRKQILFHDLKDPWVQVAALSAREGSAAALLNEVLVKGQAQPDDYRSLVQRLAALVGSGNDITARRRLILAATKISKTTPADATFQAAVLNGMAMGVDDDDSFFLLTADESHALAATVFNHPSTDVGKAALRVLRYTSIPGDAFFREQTERANAIVSDRKETDSRRALAVEFLSIMNPKGDPTLYMGLLSPQEAIPVQLAALKALSAVPGTQISETLIARWSSLTPEVQDAAIATFLHDDARTALLLGALEKSAIPKSAVNWPRRVGLMAQSNIPLRDRARKLFTENDDAEIRSSLSDVLSLQGDAVKGKDVYQQNCGLCHQLRGKLGVNIGPDLGTVHNWSAEAILSNIVSPNQSISSGFDLCSVELSNGKTVQGIIASESPGAITLRNNGSSDVTVKRSDIKSLKALNMSIMPTDFSKKISHDQLADLLAFLKQNQ